jgi:hypothetical protein
VEALIGLILAALGRSDFEVSVSHRLERMLGTVVGPLKRTPRGRQRQENAMRSLLKDKKKWL